jgi:hypothetical protein
MTSSPCFQFAGVAEFGGADRCEIPGVREQDDPMVSDPVVKADFSFGGFSLKIRGDIANSQCHEILRGVADISGNAFQHFMYGSKGRNPARYLNIICSCRTGDDDKLVASPTD